MVDCLIYVETVDPTYRLFYRAKPKFGQVFADFLGYVFEEVDNKFSLTAITRPQFLVLSSNPDRASVEVADAHHDAARYH